MWDGTSSRTQYCHCPGYGKSDNDKCTGYAQIDTKPCNQGECCSWQWGEWTTCSKTCGDGTSTRNQFCICPGYGKSDNNRCSGYSQIDSKPCNQGSCCYWQWGDWSACSKTCGAGTTSRTQYCYCPGSGKADNEKCTGNPLSDSNYCNKGDCCSWQWGEWSSCSKSCGDGTSTRTQVCNCPGYGKSDNSRCPGYAQVDSKTCNQGDCCLWQWGEWSSCSKTCGAGTSTRTQFCNCPGYGKSDNSRCPGYAQVDSKPCNQGDCCLWQWGDWSSCSKTCGDGTSTRTQFCNCPGYGKSDNSRCLGYAQVDSKPCNQGDCCSWQWGDWSSCSKTCGDGVSQRLQYCSCGYGKSENSKCQGYAQTDSRICNNGDCKAY